MGLFARTGILANGEAPPVLPTSENLIRHGKDFDESRTKLEGFFNTRYSAMMLEPGDFILKI